MLRFLVQKINGHVYHDFAQGIVDAQEYHSWLNDPFIIKYANDHVPENLKHPEKYVPVGTVDFVTEFVNLYFPDRAERILTPLNVPAPFYGQSIITRREVLYVDSVHHVTNLQNLLSRPEGFTILEDFFKDETKQTIVGYKKSTTKIKDPSNGIFECNINDLSSLKGYQISPIVPNILSEWRILVYHNKVVYAANYAGDPLIFPDKTKIDLIVNNYENAPVAYTLDVFVDDIRNKKPSVIPTCLPGLEYPNGTGLLECHNFFSCGLYGFHDWQKYPYMLSQSWYQMLFDFKVE